MVKISEMDLMVSTVLALTLISAMHAGIETFTVFLITVSLSATTSRLVDAFLDVISEREIVKEVNE